MNVPFLSGLGKPVLLTATALVLSLPSVQGSALNSFVQLGQAQASQAHKWALFTLGSGSADTDALTGAGVVTGDIGLAGSGKLNISGGATDTGNAYYHTGGSIKGAGISGTKTSNASTDSILNQGVLDAKSGALQAAGLTVTPGGPTSITTSLSLDASTKSGDVYVMNLSAFTLSNSATLSLNGDFNSTYVFNIYGAFTMATNSLVQLNGGVQAANVLFNYLGTAPVTLDTGSQLNGIILAAAPSNYGNSSIQLSANASVTGEIIADKVSLSGGATVTQGIVSP